MDTEKLREAIVEIIADVAPDEDLSEIKEEEPLRDQLGLDSMDFLDIVMELRKRYKVEVPENDYPQLRTLKSTIEYLKPRMPSPA